MTGPVAFQRWLKFNAVGASGAAAQLGALALLHGVARIGYLPATALAVECAILNNFVWHERWTWRDRSGRGRAIARLARFHLTSGAVSMLANLAGMRVLAGAYRAPYLAANLATIAAGAAANFLAADRFVFRRGR